MLLALLIPAYQPDRTLLSILRDVKKKSPPIPS